MKGTIKRTENRYGNGIYTGYTIADGRKIKVCSFGKKNTNNMQLCILTMEANGIYDIEYKD